MAFASLLSALLQTLRIDAGPITPGPGEPVAARIVQPPAPAGLSLVDLTQSATGALDVGAGSIGQITGSLPTSIDAPVRLEVQWYMRDESDSTELPEGNGMNDGYLALSGLNGLEAAFLIRPDVVELNRNPNLSPRTRWLHARVRASVQDTSVPPLGSTPFELPGIPISTVPVPLPTILVLFQHAQFRGKVTIVVPQDSPFAVAETLLDTLAMLQPISIRLIKFRGIAPLLLGIRTLTLTVKNPDKVAFLTSTPNFEPGGDGTYLPFNIRTTKWLGGIKGGIKTGKKRRKRHHASSMIFIGPSKAPKAPDAPYEGREVECLTDGDDMTDPYFIVQAKRSIAVTISSLADRPLWSIPEDHVSVPEPGKFNERLQAVRFGWRTLP